MLIAARVVQGVGAALMNPATLSIITVTFPPRQRGTAIGIWAGVSALALAIGPLVGGLITEHINWNWIFFINVPVGVIGIAAALRVHRRVARHLARAAADVPGLVTSANRAVRAHLRPDRGEQLRLDARRASSVAFAIAAVSLVGVRPARAAPAVADARPLAVPRTVTFTGANTVMLLVGLAMFGVFFYVSLYVQNVLGYSPIQAGRSVPADGRVLIIVRRAAWPDA